MKNKSFLMIVEILYTEMHSVAQVKGTIADSSDGKIYKTVIIGTQTWKTVNHAYKANRGCWTFNNKQSKVVTYGYLYNLEIAKSVYPSGWHLPSFYEWSILTDYLGGKDIAGCELKSTINCNTHT